jgi:membrane-associated phospholipid phosphatase
MDAIDTIDWGAYAHFAFVAQKHPGVAEFMSFPYYISTYAAVLAIMASVCIFFLLQNRSRAALATSLGLIFSMGIIEFCRLLVPRVRPPDAENWLGPNERLGSYPSAGVFLFMLTMIFLGFALWRWLPTVGMRLLFVLLAVALTVSVAIGQLFLALHYVSDIVGGIVGAATVGYVVSRFLDTPISPTDGATISSDEKSEIPLHLPTKPAQ